MKKLKLIHKITIMIIPFVISLIFLSYFFIGLSNKTLNFTNKEKLGVTVLNQLVTLLNDATSYNIAMNKVIINKSEQNDLNSKISLNFDKLSALPSYTINSLSLDTSSLNSSKNGDLDIAALRRQWQEVESNKENVDKFSKLYGPFRNNLMALISYVGNKSNLILDPDLDSYYLTDSSLVRLPILIDRLGNIFASNAATIASKNYAKLGHDNLVMAKSWFNDNDLSNINSDLSTSFSETAYFNNSSTLQSNINPKLDRFNNMTAKLNQILANLLSNSGDQSYDSFSEILLQTKSASADLENVILQELDVLLNLRISHSHFYTYFAFTIAGISLLIAIITAIFITSGIKDSFNQLIHRFAEMAAGDFSKEFEFQKGDDEVSEIMKSVNETIIKIREVIKKITSASEVLNDAAHDISSGTSDFAGRTESQASAIEETAAAMQQITSTVKQNSDNTLGAKNHADCAFKFANEGENVLKDAILAVLNIDKSSQKITDIISVIDAIAFQTNLLALNAAVEAARAGEVGKGFAVVASEVRALAGRSAAASKEIKELIINSAKEVKFGVDLVQRAGDKLKDIIDSTNLVNNIISQIADAGIEQNRGINEVNIAISQMDTVTQQNAALVEETSAAVNSLAQQSSELKALIKFFKIENK